ncbi:M23 family metallopeptidase [bacterium]|nr:M23 family metallopeptidase [bacterium]
MLSNKLTIILVPQKDGGILSFELSSFVIKMIILAVSVFTLISIGISIDYFLILEKSKNQRDLERVLMMQTVKIQEINNQLLKKQTDLENFEEFDRKLRLITGLQESSTRIRYIGGNGNAFNGENSKKFEDLKLINKLKKLDLDTKLREISFFQLGAYLQERTDKLARTPSIAPTKGHFSSRFGKRIDPFTGKIKMHNGLDFSNRRYSPIVAPADGVVVNTFVNGSFGEFLVIDHGYNIVTRYGHLSKYEVQVGQNVKRGDLIARIGNTGRSTAPHLHYEVLVNDQYEDPEKYLLE